MHLPASSVTPTWYRGTAFQNEIIEELLRMTGVEQSLTAAYSSEENGIV
jgi:hypothetical protein